MKFIEIPVIKCILWPLDSMKIFFSAGAPPRTHWRS